MLASAPAALCVARARRLITLIVAGTLMAVAPGVPRFELDRGGLVDLEWPGMQALSVSEMGQVTGGWLEPKARKTRTGCPACQQCQVTSSGGSSPDGSGPSLDVTTGEVFDHLGLLSLGASGGSVRFAVTYSSHLADGTNSILDTTMGAGWVHSYGDYLLVRGSDYIWIRGDTEVVRFTRLRNIFRSSTGQFFSLQLTGASSGEIRDTEGTVYRFEEAAVAWPAPGVVYALKEIIDRNHRATTLAYSGGLLAGVTGPYGQQLTFEYDAQHRLDRVQGAGREVRFEYTAATGQLSAVELPHGARVEYAYDAGSRMRAKTVPGGGTYRIDVDAQNRPSRLRDPSGLALVSQSNPGGWAPDHANSLATGEMQYVPGTTTVADGRGHVRVYEYDARGCITRRTDPAGGVVTIEYEGSTLLPARIVDENGHVTHYEYDSRGNRTLVRDAEGNETHYEYEPTFNQVTRMIEPDGDVWVYRYDAFGNLVEEVDPLVETPDDATLRYTYQADGLRTSRTDRNNHTTRYEYDPLGNMVKVTDPAGAVTTYAYDPFGNRISQTVHNDSGDQVTTYTYDTRDRLVTSTDPLGTTSRFEYDAEGNRVREYTQWVDDTTFRTRTDHGYDDRDQLVLTVEDATGAGRTSRYEYDGNGNRTSAADPNGHVTVYQYDPLDRLIRTERDPGGLGLVTRYTFDAHGNRISQTDANGHTTTYQYDALDRLTRTIDPLGHATRYDYALPGGGGCPCGTPGSASVKCVTDAEGKVTRYEYDALDRRTKEIRKVGEQSCDAGEDADDAVTRYHYDPGGNVLTVVDPNGNAISFAYTDRDEIASWFNGAGETTTYDYDAAGNRTGLHLPNGNAVQYAYDSANRLIHVVDAIGGVVTYTYDAVGNRTQATDALGHTTAYTYDGLDRLVVQTDAMGRTATFDYDAVGNQTRVIDRNGNRTTYTYDAADRRTELHTFPDADGAPSVTRHAYDGVGQVVRIIDANGHATRYEYDAANRRIREVLPDETSQRYAYDGVGNLLTREDFMGDGGDPGNLTDCSYDDLHRLTRLDYATGEFERYTYDAGGRVLAAANGHSHVGFTYDGADRLLTSTLTDLPVTYSHTVSYAYDVVANLRVITYPSGRVVTEKRDLRDRPALVSDASGPVAIYTYDSADRLTTKAFGNATHARYTHNDNNWTAGLRHLAPDGTTTLAGFAFEFDREGNRLSARNLQEALPYNDTRPVTHSDQYAYDDTYRLIEHRRGPWVNGGVPAPRRLRIWDLDPVHNWKRFGVQDLDVPEHADLCNSINQVNEYNEPSNDGPPPVPDDDGSRDDFAVSSCPATAMEGDFDDDRDVDADDLFHLVGCASGPRIPQTEPDCLDADLDADGDVDQDDFGILQRILGTAGTGFNLVYDKNGNLIDDGVREYYYDLQTAASSPLRSLDRLTRIVEKATGTILAEFLYDALGRKIRERAGGVDRVMLYDGWQILEAYESGLPAETFINGGAWDEVLAVDQASSSQRHYLHAGTLNTVIALTNSSGEVTERYAYDSYGEPAYADGAGLPLPGSAQGQRLLFMGRPYLAESRLYDYRHRHLHVRLGRFTSRDPLGGWGDPANVGNAYALAASDPVNGADPLGLATWSLKPQTAQPATESWGKRGQPRVYTGTGTGWIYDLSIMFGSFRITPTSAGGDATLENTYWHDWTAFWGRSEHKVGVKWHRQYECDRKTGELKYVDGEGPRSNPSFKSDRAFAHMQVNVTRVSEKKVQIAVEVKTGVSANVTVKHSFGAEGGIGGHEGKPGAKITLGTEWSQTGDVGETKGTAKDWEVECVCDE